LFKENIIYASLHNVDATGLNLVIASNNANTLSGNLLWRGTDNVSASLAPSIIDFVCGNSVPFPDMVRDDELKDALLSTNTNTDQTTAAVLERIFTVLET
jgi:hypothetical protein